MAAAVAWPVSPEPGSTSTSSVAVDGTCSSSVTVSVSVQWPSSPPPKVWANVGSVPPSIVVSPRVSVQWRGAVWPSSVDLSVHATVAPAGPSGYGPAWSASMTALGGGSAGAMSSLPTEYVPSVAQTTTDACVAVV